MPQSLSNTIPVVIITGLSGSGKSTALDVFEDMGFYRVDGLPSFIIPNVLNLLNTSDFAGSCGLVLGVDLRQEASVAAFESSLHEITKNGLGVSVLFFEAKNEILVTRYAATRRPHPLQKEGLGLEQAIDIERSRLLSVRHAADLVLDTSQFSIHDLRRALQKKWQALRQDPGPSLRVHMLSFGFKYGTPSEADFVFDLRYLPNPYFIKELKPLSGQAPEVAAFVLDCEQGKESLNRIRDFLTFMLTQNEKEGRFRLTIAIGCTGGRHRSVAMAEALTRYFMDQNYVTSLEHRHLELG